MSNVRILKTKEELIKIIHDKKESYSIIEAKIIVEKLNSAIHQAETNELFSRFLKMNGMDSGQIDAAITQLNKLREKL